MKVRAISTGYFGDQLREEGSVFEITPREVEVGRNHRYTTPSGALVYGVKHGGKTYKIGDTFTISEEEQFSSVWMEKLETPKKTTK